jgi:pimeloyl-ACP methyl ester carboxylesterase
MEKRQAGTNARAVALIILVLAAGILSACVGSSESQNMPSAATPSALATPATLAAKGRVAGATQIYIRQRTDGGILLHGRLEGREFVIDIPLGWQGPSALFARGYNIPGMPMTIPDDLVDLSDEEDPWGGFPTAMYKQGYAVGQTIYDKTGLAIESGTVNNIRLKRVFDQIGSTRVLMTGESMGGSIALSVIDQNPGVFDGALTACAIADNLPDEIGAVVDMRAVYDYFTMNTKYALPGSKDLHHNALDPVAPAWLSWLPPMNLLYAGIQIKRITTPVDEMFTDAQEDPHGQAAQIIANIASAAGTEPDPGSFTWRILLAAIGTDDVRETYGGNIYGNRNKIYHADGLSAAENTTLNLKIGRVDADAAAVEKATQWHASTGRMTTPTVTMHNRYDALVPYSQEIGLQRKVSLAGNDANLLQLAVPSKEAKVIVGDFQGYTHCGFTPAQVRYEIGLADDWARTKRKPGIEQQYEP